MDDGTCLRTDGSRGCWRGGVPLHYTGKSNNSLYFPHAHAPTCARAVTPNKAQFCSLKTWRNIFVGKCCSHFGVEWTAPSYPERLCESWDNWTALKQIIPSKWDNYRITLLRLLDESVWLLGRKHLISHHITWGVFRWDLSTTATEECDETIKRLRSENGIIRCP